MLLSKLKVCWVVALVLAVVVSAGGGLTYRAAAQGPVQGRFVATDGGARNALDDHLEAIRLEMEALRKEVRALRERVKTLEAQAGAPKGGGQTAAEPAGPGVQHNLAVDLVWTLRDPLAEAEAALKKLRQNPSDKEAADGLGRALQQIRSRGLKWQQQASPGGGGLPPGANPVEGAKVGQAAQAPAAEADGKTFYYILNTFEVDPVAAAEAALQKLRASPGDKQAAEALEQALKRLKDQRTPAKGLTNPAK